MTLSSIDGAVDEAQAGIAQAGIAQAGIAQAGLAQAEAVGLLRDPIPEAVHAVLALFRDELRDVSFPDVGRASLEGLAERAREEELEIERLEAELEQARGRGRAAIEALGEQAKRAIAYARVFAAGREELEAKLTAFGVASMRIDASAAPAGAARRRGRPRKDAANAPLLAIEASNEAPGEASSEAPDEAVAEAAVAE